ncbi:DUF2231 domain-containing protein [Hymenobacter glacialis]|uniref:DUF2231 domain-containing protein n=1 Tax=Hymenobacter glacialis TaxID=1908236 RepID=A0A1G1T6L0_9BACT|nr:DUF2231 domain-containing protein [Hymenobacter glacialis]OGX86489.1 hypothetical protein BEN48_12705 [Hymenobacter glacialis]
MFEDFPNLHPLVVHFPIVLLLLGAALQAVLVYKVWPPVKWITIGVMAGGFAGALAASTVFHALPVGLAPRAAAVYASHEQFAGYTLWLSGITLLLAGIGKYFRIERRAYEVLVLVSAVATAGVLSVAGHRGAQLIYVEGVGPQGRLLDKSHGHGGEEPLPGMDMEADGHVAAEGAEGQQNDSPTASGRQAPLEMPASQEMPGMDMSGNNSPRQGSSTAPGQMGDMDMSGSQPARPARSASPAGAVPDMPGMKMPSSKGTQPMPAGMDMSRPTKPKQLQMQMEAMPEMENMPGRNKPAAGAKKPAKDKSGMEGMGNMTDMPGMPAPSPRQPTQARPPMGNMQDMPGMEKGQAMPTMPGMSMPANPMDRFRFEDNNPARNQPKTDKQ